jgi:hypothetical protein
MFSGENAMRSRSFSDRTRRNAGLILLLGCVAASAWGTSLSGSIGYYEPDDGIVRDLFRSDYLVSLGLGFTMQPDLDWTTGAIYHVMGNTVNGLESDLTLISLTGGFEKRFVSPPDYMTYMVEPFFGAGISLNFISDVLKVKASGETSRDPMSATGGFYWKTGLLFPISALSSSRVTVELMDHVIIKDILGGVNLGGMTLSVGFRRQF